MEKMPLYAIEKKEKNHLELSREQTESVRDITLGIEEVDQIVRELAVDDVVRTLENGHPSTDSSLTRMEPFPGISPARISFRTRHISNISGRQNQRVETSLPRFRLF